MKKIILFFVMIFALEIFPQTPYESKWDLGIGFTYPRFMNITGDGYSRNDNLGGEIWLGYWFNEYVSLEALLAGVQMKTIYYAPFEKLHKVNLFSLNINAVYRFLPCEKVSPFFMVGIGPTALNSDNPLTLDYKDYKYGYQGSFGLGVYGELFKKVSLRVSATYNVSSDNKIDGNSSINENKSLFGNGDTYMKASLSFVWSFFSGKASDLCDKCPGGIKNYYDVKVYPPKSDEVAIPSPSRDTIYKEIPQLFNVHFKFDSSNLDLEQYPILDHAVNLIKSNPELKVLIQGGADYRGSDDYNLVLSKRRAGTVKNYFISKGISSDRIIGIWSGEKEPLKGDKTPVGNAYDRYVIIKWNLK